MMNFIGKLNCIVTISIYWCYFLINKEMPLNSIIDQPAADKSQKIENIIFHI